MSPVGHILTGTAIGVAFQPANKSKKWKAIYYIALSFFANIPDIQLSYWGHHKYYFFSHSLFVNCLLILILVMIFVLWKKLREKIGGWKIVIACVSAWLSHLLLDTFYNQENGLMMFWPFSDARLRLAMPWFSVVKTIPPPITSDHIRIVLIELAFYGSLLVVTILMKMLILKLQKQNK